ncbi:zinc finger protein elbow B isoform 1-T2 [Cochliomyia hominivorax]
MLQSSNQYLRPDYMVAPTAIPHSSQLDTKSSPLALLAQTCSAIGADTTNPKLLAANIEKATKAHKSSSSSSLDNRDKSSPLSSHSSVSTGSVEQQQQQQQQQQLQQTTQQSQPVKCSFKPYETNNNHIRERLDDNEQATNLSQSHSQIRVKTPKTSSNSLGQNGLQNRCDSNQSATSQRGESPAINGGLRRTPSSSQTETQSLQQQQHQQQHHSQQRTQNSPAHQKAKETAINGGSSVAAATTSLTATSPTHSTTTSASTRLQATSEAAYAAASKEASYVKALQAAAAAGQGNSSAAAAAASYYPGYPASMPYPMDLMTASALMSPHHPMFKAAALNPYLNYARLKGLDMPQNICRDPYCTGCPSSPHFLNKAAGQPCPAGCPQCEREGKSSGSSSSAAAAAAAASSYHAQLAALAAASQMPYVCSWIGGDTPYCGKRFATSDELFQHLRTHTASLPESVLTAAAQGGIPPNHPLFQRTYPTPPLSPLSAARYHPYGKPSMLPPSLAGAPPGSLASLQMQQHPALAQYFSPYSLYGPRMGSSHP